MTIYQNLLGEDFKRLHPQLQSRYALPKNKPFCASGKMTLVQSGTGWLYPFLKLATKRKFLFPESGNNIPFTIRNTSRSLSHELDEVYWERTFYFDHVTRYFNAFMTIDSERKVVKDYLGEPSLFYSDLHFNVTPEGHLNIRSGVQRLVIGKLEISIPSFLRGVVEVEEGYDDTREVFTIRVHIQNRIVGRLMAYEGEFKETSI
ncbi:DUF4166 domain-containing protein [Fictibacillus nanhaiensis]|uniref:DUF4166 domain-containing protein n=1 Tax=Fictibacillus nanhaiensis TaxID=742169 RepID=A0ABS2ZPI0_9BACL|nr:DUF4166 domain-containing protein [Fictibacillus nanhaiensis]